MKQKYQCHKVLDKNAIMIILYWLKRTLEMLEITLFCIYNGKAEEGVVATNCSLRWNENYAHINKPYLWHMEDIPCTDPPFKNDTWSDKQWQTPGWWVCVPATRSDAFLQAATLF